jgi:hypothetical protein
MPTFELETKARDRQAVYTAEVAHLESLARMLLANARTKAIALLGDRFRSIEITLSAGNGTIGSAVSSEPTIWIFTTDAPFSGEINAYGGESSFAEVFDNMQQELAAEARAKASVPHA